MAKLYLPNKNTELHKQYMKDALKPGTVFYSQSTMDRKFTKMVVAFTCDRWIHGLAVYDNKLRWATVEQMPSMCILPEELPEGANIAYNSSVDAEITLNKRFFYELFQEQVLGPYMETMTGSNNINTLMGLQDGLDAVHDRKATPETIAKIHHFIHMNPAVVVRFW